MEFENQLKQALEELRKSKERKFDQTVDLIVNLQKIDLKKTNINIIEVKKGFVFYNDVREPNSKVQTIKTNSVFLATGRLPNTKNLDLKKGNIKVGKRGEIVINNYSLLGTGCQIPGARCFFMISL